MTESRLTLSRRSERISRADIRTMTVECERVGGINLAQGVCDMAVPEPVLRGAERAMRSGVNAYTRHDGLSALREAVAAKMRTFNGIVADADGEVIISGGATGALYCACIALLDPGDEVIVFEPYYGYHLNTLLAVDAVPRFVRMSPPDWRFSIADVRAVIGPRTKAILLNTPGNPTGKVYSEEELRALARLAVENDLFVLSDEIYEYFVYDGYRHVSPGSLPEIADRTITVSGYSKTFSITGWRIGYCVAKRRWADTIGYVNDLVYVCAPAPLQIGVAEGITGLGPAYYEDLRRDFSRKRAMVSSALQEAGFRFALPQGAYYILADASHVPGADGREKAMYLLGKTGIASVPGECFFGNGGGANLLRFCYAKEDAELGAVGDRLRRLRS
jgi:aminotransferase